MLLRRSALIALCLALFLPFVACRKTQRPAAGNPICYECFWQGQLDLRTRLITFYEQYQTPDPLVAADVRTILWRAKNQPDCAVREEYRKIAENDSDPLRRYIAASAFAFSAPDCSAPPDFAYAARFARDAGLNTEARLLTDAAAGKLTPQFAPNPIATAITVPPNATRIVLGTSRITVDLETRIGSQVERVARDWMSYQLNAKLDNRPLLDFPIPYHEGAVVKALSTAASASAYPLTGTLIYRKDGQWYAPDENGVFRFHVLDDKVQYPTTHAVGDFGFIADTHGISALVAQAVENDLNLVIGCGDSDGKAEAAYYLAQKGINVVFPGDRYQDVLLGYQGSGTILGTAPVRSVGNKAVIGDQAVAIGVNELIVVQNTDRKFPIQYYDAPARYFRRLAKFVPLKLDFAMIDGEDQIDIVLSRAQQKRAQVVGVRVMTGPEDASLRRWLKLSPKNRAVLFHSGLYPYAQPLFRDFPKQVTFGDLRPRFE